MLSYVSILLLLYKYTSQLYQSLRFMNYSRTSEYHYKVIDLLFAILIIAHVLVINVYKGFNIVLYDETYHRSQLDIKIWTWNEKSVGLVDLFFLFCCYHHFYCWIRRHFSWESLWGFYCNPRLNMRYLIQYLGIIVFAFIINEIGFCLSSMRKSE